MAIINNINKNIFYFLVIVFTFSLLLFDFISAKTKPIEVDLTWSTNAYIPLEYPGKALPITGSMIEVVANVSSDINIKDLEFRWFLNGDFKKSDFGKDVFQFKVEKRTGQKEEIKLLIFDKQKNKLAEKYLFIKIISPQIVIYNQHIALTNFCSIKSNQNLKILAKPYFFNIDHPNDLEYSWDFAGKKAEQISQENPNVLNLEISKANKEFTQILHLYVQNKKNLLENAIFEWNVKILP